MAINIRDTQRQKVYDAERAAAHAVGRRFEGQTIKNADLQAYADKVLATRAIAARWPGRKVTIELGKYGGRAYWNGRITLGVVGRNEWFMLHEIAHTLAPRDVAGHGPEYVGIYLFLVQTMLGKEAADAMRAAFKKYRVRKSNVAIPQPIDRTEERLRKELAALRKEQHALGQKVAAIQTQIREHRTAHSQKAVS